MYLLCWERDNANTTISSETKAIANQTRKEKDIHAKSYLRDRRHFVQVRVYEITICFAGFRKGMNKNNWPKIESITQTIRGVYIMLEEMLE